jgi:hypothetical protein
MLKGYGRWLAGGLPVVEKCGIKMHFSCSKLDICCTLFEFFCRFCFKNTHHGVAPLIEAGPGYPLIRLQALRALAGTRYYP